MSARRRQRAGAAWAVVMGLAGCGGGHGTSWGVEKSWSSEHFIYHARVDDDSVDATVMDQLEANATLIRGWLGLGSEPWGPVHYFKYRSIDDLVAAHGPCPATACTNMLSSGRIEVHTPLAIDQHELTHSYHLPVGCAPKLLMEGLATSVSCDPPTESTLAMPAGGPGWLQGSWRDLDSFEAPAPTSYPAAGALVTWLIDGWGTGAFMDLYRATACHDGPDAIAAAFNARYGVSLDDVWSQLQTAPRRRLCTFVEGCAEPEATGDVVLGNQAAGYRVAAPMPAAGALVRASFVTGAVAPFVRACDATGALSRFDGYWPLRPTAWSPVVLAPGSSRAVVALGDVRGTNADPTQALSLTVTGLPAASAGSDPGSCAGAQPLAIDDLAVTLLIWPQPAPLVLGLRSTVAASTLTTRFRYDGAVGSVEACSDCVNGVLQGCGDAALVDTLNAPWIRIHWAPSSFEVMTLAVQWL